MRKEKGPPPGGAGNGQNRNSSDNNDSTGAAGKQWAFDLFQEHRAERLAEARRVLVAVLGETGQATINDVRQRMEIPTEYDPRWLGAVPGPLARRGIIRRVGYVPSGRAHDRLIALWELVRLPRPGELDEIATNRRKRPDGPEDEDGAAASPSKRPDVPGDGYAAVRAEVRAARRKAGSLFDHLDAPDHGRDERRRP